MAYSLPELVLVGAAQTLVLEGSSLGLKQADIDCNGPNDRDFIVPVYDWESTW